MSNQQSTSEQSETTSTRPVSSGKLRPHLPPAQRQRNPDEVIYTARTRVEPHIFIGDLFASL